MQKRISSLSEAYPEGTAYYYGYPVGWDSSFLNECPAAVEELVAMRPAVCAGKNVNVVTYANTVTEDVQKLLRNELGVPYIAREQMIVMPSSLTTAVAGKERNSRVKDALKNQVGKGRLAMAQPYLDEEVRDRYLIDPRITAGLNDKKNAAEIFPADHMIPEYARCNNGQEFAALSAESMQYPCVVKISSSSAGDGVRLCKNPVEFTAAQQQFGNSEGMIIIQKMIDIDRETEVKFVVHEDRNQSAELLGYSDEITGTNGEYLGGIIKNEQIPDAMMQRVFASMQRDVLPRAREKGWYGVGGVGVLMDKEGEFYYCDPNFRMTAMMPQVLEMNAGHFDKRSVFGFGAKFQGTVDSFRDTVGSHAKMGDANQLLNIVSMAQHGDSLDFHGGILFDQPETLRDNLLFLKALGVRSEAFEAMHHVNMQKHLQ